MWIDWLPLKVAGTARTQEGGSVTDTPFAFAADGKDNRNVNG